MKEEVIGALSGSAGEWAELQDRCEDQAFAETFIEALAQVMGL